MNMQNLKDGAIGYYHDWLCKNAAIRWAMQAKYLGVTVSFFGNTCTTVFSYILRTVQEHFISSWWLCEWNVYTSHCRNILHTHTNVWLWSMVAAKYQPAQSRCCLEQLFSTYIFQCCWRETTRPQFYCKSLQLRVITNSIVIDERINCSCGYRLVVLQTMSVLNRNEFIATCTINTAMMLMGWHIVGLNKWFGQFCTHCFITYNIF